MVSSSKAGRIASVGLRFFVLLLCLAAAVIIARDTVTVPEPEGDTTLHFKDVLAYRYLFSVAVIGTCYSIIQIPVAALSISKGNKLISKQLVPLYIFIDVVISLLLATGAGAGFGFTVDIKRGINQLARRANAADSQLAKDINKALDLGNVAAGFVLGAAGCMAFIILISVLALARK